MSETDLSVVPAHGGWSDGSSWSKVVTALRSEGVKAVTAPLTSLADDVAALDRMLERVEGPVVVAGNAYAGAVIASTSDEKVASLVSVAALAPDEGETVGDIFYRAEPCEVRSYSDAVNSYDMCLSQVCQAATFR
jgi:pimeloyl-ACP methyl ester carboxylesterase